MREAASSPPADESEPKIADVTRLPLDAVLGHDDSVLDNAVRRLLRDLERQDENYAAHGSSTL